MADARLKSLCQQKKMFYGRISGFSCTTYNHFTQQNDIFTHLTDRLVLLDTKDVGEKFKDKASSFEETFAVIKDRNGKEYLLQRDLYAAAKMIYCTPKEIEEKGRKKTIWVFDQKGFEKFFEEVFYPQHKIYIQELIRQRNLGIKMSGTILGR